jgi:hypothetical protein
MIVSYKKTINKWESFMYGLILGIAAASLVIMAAADIA